MAMHSGNDITNDLNTVCSHSRTSHDLEDYKDTKMECSVTSENCSETSFNEDVEVNYDSFKEENIKIEEHELDSFIKSETFDTGSDAETTNSLRQWSKFPNEFNLELQHYNRSSQKHNVESKEQLKDFLDTKSNVAAMHSRHNYALAAVNDTADDDIFLPEPWRSDECEEHNGSSGENSTKSSCLLRQCNKLDLVNYNANNENFNSATTSAEFSTQQGNCVTKSQVGIVSMEPSSSSVGLLRQRKVNVTKIADLSNTHSIKRRFKNISSTESHSRINKPCKRANRRVLYNCHQKGKNIKEKIVAKSELHSVPQWHNPPSTSRSSLTATRAESPARSSASSRSANSSLSDADRIMFGQMQATIAAMAENIAALNNKVDILLANQQGSTFIQNPEYALLGLLPLQNLEDFNSFEEKAKSDDNFANQFVKVLASTGGKDMKTSIMNMLRRLMSDLLAEQFSYSGKIKNDVQKIAFCKKKLCNAIHVAARKMFREEATDDKIRGVVCNWFQQAKTRRTRRDLRNQIQK